MLIDSDAALGRRLDAVIDGVLEQRLQHERRNERVARHALDVPVDLEPIAEAQLLELEILAAQLDFVGQRREVAVVAHQHAKEIGQILERRLGAARLAAHQRQHRGDAVEQEVRPDARLQCLQSGFGDRRRKRARAQPEVADQQKLRDECEREVTRERPRRFADQLRRQHIEGDRERARDRRDDRHGRSRSRRASATAARAHSSAQLARTGAARRIRSATPTRRRACRQPRLAASATTSVAPLTASRMRRIEPRLRKSGNAGGSDGCLIIPCIADAICKHHAGCRQSLTLRGSPAPCAAAIPTVSCRSGGALVADLRRARTTRCPHAARIMPAPDPSLPARHCANAERRHRAAARRHLVGPVRRADVRADAALQRVGRLRPAPGARRHRGLPRACADARRAAAS